MSVPDISLPGVGVLRMGQPAHFYWLALTVVLLCLWVASRFTRTPLGNAVLLMRENDERAAFLGYSVKSTKLIVFTVAATLAAVAGGLFASFPRLISPTSLDLPSAPRSSSWRCSAARAAFSAPSSARPSTSCFQDWLSRTTDRWPFVLGLLFVLMVLYAHSGVTGLLGRDGPVRRLWTRPPAEETA